jgi:hypothetical protein
VYIQEAHPVDLWQDSSNVKDGVLLASLVDGIDNRVERAYTWGPDRLYLIGTDGRVRFKSGPGPFGFSTAALEQALKQTLQ